MNYSLVGISDDTVERIGGKAAILEEIVKRMPKANVPAFRVYEKPSDIKPPSWLSKERTRMNVFRSSSNLDLLGGFGLFTTVTEVMWSDYKRAIQLLEDPDQFTSDRLFAFIDTNDLSLKMPSPVIVQEQRQPHFWTLVTEHPNSPGTFIVNRATQPSHEAVDSFAVKGPWNRETYTTVAINMNGSLRRIDGSPLMDIDRAAIQTYQSLTELGIVDPEVVSIAELGCYNDGRTPDIFQLTPLCRRNITRKPREDYFVSGPNVHGNFPLVRFETAFSPYEHIMENINRNRWEALRELDAKFDEGYILLTEARRQLHDDIPVKNAALVLLERPEPFDILNRNGARFLYKNTTVISGLPSWTIHEFETGDRVCVSIDENSVKINKIDLFSS